MIDVKALLTKILTHLAKVETKTLLWTNPNTSANFAGQSFSVASGYDYVEIVTTSGLRVRGAGEFNMCRYGWGNGGAQLYARSATYTKSSGAVWFDNGVVAGIANMTNFSIDNSVMKPWKIYGIK